MPDNPSSHDDKVRSFWDRYVGKLHESGIKPPFDRWTVRRAEEYIAAHPERRLAEQTPADVDAYPADLGRKPGFKDRQFRQAMGAHTAAVGAGRGGLAALARFGGNPRSGPSERAGRPRVRLVAYRACRGAAFLCGHTRGPRVADRTQTRVQAVPGHASPAGARSHRSKPAVQVRA